MKTLLSFLLVFVGLIQLSAQTIPNAGFENWTLYNGIAPWGSFSGFYPDGWTTSDSVTQYYQGGSSVYQGTTDPFEGSNCMHLKSTEIFYIAFFLKGPGIATNGKMNLVSGAFQYSGGAADTTRSRFLTGRYKYLKKGPNEVGSLKVFLLQDSIPGGAKDTIAMGVTLFTDSVDTYQPFLTQIVYRDYVEQPDTFIIIIQSSKNIADTSIVVGTELIIDSLNFTGYVGMNELSNFINSANIYPSPANDQLNIEVELKKETSLKFEIYDLNGKLMKDALMSSNKERVDISDLSAGNYVLKLLDTKQKSLYTTSFLINR